MTTVDKAAVLATDDRREQMLRAALEVIADRGFPETRIADVAERAGASPALVIYYFRTKDALLTEAMRYAEDRFYDLGSTRTAGLSSARDRLEAIVRMCCLEDPEEDPPDSWLLWLDLWAQAVRHPQVAVVRQEFDERWRATISSIVREGQSAGEFGPVDADDFAVCFSALLDGLAVQMALGDKAVDARRAFRLAMEAAATTLDFDWSPEPERKRRMRRRRG
jgi:AcrR family transcriptional regulator